MQCPSCHERLKSETLHGETVDRCPMCDGLWLDRTELGTIVRHHVASSDVSATAERSDQERACPRCEEAMADFHYAHDSGIVVQRCRRCRGIWLEPGQLDRIARFRTGSPATRRLEQALGDRLRASENLGFVRRLLRSRLLSGLVVLGYVVAVWAATGSPQALLSLAIFLVLPVACIWFPDALGNLTGVSLGVARPVITQTTPADFVAFGGWLLLLCPAVMAWINRAG